MLVGHIVNIILQAKVTKSSDSSAGMVKELDEERSKVATALKEQQQMKTLLEQKSIELKKKALLSEELTDKIERLSQERDNIMAERNKLAMEQQTLLADKEVGNDLCCIVCVFVCVCVCVCVYV